MNSEIIFISRFEQLWRHYDVTNVKISNYILRRKIAILVQNEEHNSKTTFISRFRELWRHYDVTNVKNQTVCFEKKNSSSGAKWAVKFENRIHFMIRGNTIKSKVRLFVLTRTIVLFVALVEVALELKVWLLWLNHTLQSLVSIRS